MQNRYLRGAPRTTRRLPVHFGQGRKCDKRGHYEQGKLKGGSIIVLVTSYLIGLD
jgi:hypothetical protein